MAAVGRMAGVSQITVSRALREPSKVSPATMARIERAIEATGYVPNAVAGALASRKSQLVTALVPSIANPIYSNLVQAFTEAMREAGYQILLSETGHDPAREEALVAAHLSRRPDAMLLTGIHHTPRARKLLLGAHIPVVEVWDITDTPIDMCVGFSHAEAGRRAAEFALAAGHARMATISANDTRARRRAAAFAARIREDDGRVIGLDLEGAASIAEGRRSLGRLIADHGFTDGLVFCSSDLLAHGVLIEAAARGIAVPDRLAVMGFGDQDFAASVEPALTTISVDRQAQGNAAASAVIARLGGARTEPVHDLGFTVMRRASA